MTAPRAAAFADAVLKAIGEAKTIVSASERNPSTAPWPEVASFDLATSDGRRFRLSCRHYTFAHPVDRVDFVEMDSDPQVHLVIVYLDAESGDIDRVPAPFILARQWRQVTHVYWSGEHPFEPGPVFGPPVRSAPTEVRPDLDRRNGRDPPRFSIITIVYNGEPLIEQAIQSVLLNKAGDVEYIVVDGDSRDGTVEIINRYRDHIDFWISEPDRGIYDALNKAIDFCRGDIIGAIHANDLYTTNALDHIRRALDANPDADLVYGRLNYVDRFRAWTSGKAIESTREMVMYGNFNHPTCFVRADAYSRFGKFEQRWSIAGDYELGIRFWKSGARFVYVDETISHFRRGGTSGNLMRNQWQRHRIRVGSGESRLFSYLVLGLTLANYYIKLPVRAVLDMKSRRG